MLGHQWRRPLQRQLGPSVREPDAADQPDRGRVAERDRLRHGQSLFGRVAGARKEARALLAAMVILSLARRRRDLLGRDADAAARHGRQPASTDAPANMEGKEVRFGAAASPMWAAASPPAPRTARSMRCTAPSCRSAAVIAMFLMQLGEILPGGVGSGLYGMVVMASARGLRRRPDGRAHAGISRQEGRGARDQVRHAGGADPAARHARLLGAPPCCRKALKGLLNKGPHGLSEILYAYSSAAGNNGSAFAGLTANAPWWNTTLGIAMLLGRFASSIPVLAIAGSIAAKPKLARSAGTLPTDGGLFVGLLIGIILILGGLQFFPALALGPIVEHFQVLAAAR
jgi:K+-transporting ATPase ATPase A chain